MAFESISERTNLETTIIKDEREAGRLENVSKADKKGSLGRGELICIDWGDGVV